MKLAFCLSEYFPYGGLQSDCLRIASQCVKAGHEVVVLTREWEGNRPEDVEIQLLPTKGLSNVVRVSRYVDAVHQYLKDNPVDGVVGFSKMPGLDIYYAADLCFALKAEKKYHAMYRYTPHYRVYESLERGVFGDAEATQIFLINPKAKEEYQSIYHTPDERFHMLPPGIQRDRCAPVDYDMKRQELRDHFMLEADRKLVLLIGSGFKTKGLDRALNAVASLPAALRAQTDFWVVGQDNPRPYQKIISQAGLEKTVSFLGGRDDVPNLLMAADVLIHPAYFENTGTVLLEAAVAGLPVLTTDTCGYAHYIHESGAGIVIPSPFDQVALNQGLLTLINHPQPWRDRGIAFGVDADIYDMAEQAAQQIETLIAKKPC